MSPELEASLKAEFPTFYHMTSFTGAPEGWAWVARWFGQRGEEVARKHGYAPGQRVHCRHFASSRGKMSADMPETFSKEMNKVYERAALLCQMTCESCGLRDTPDGPMPALVTCAGTPAVLCPACEAAISVLAS